VHAERGAGRFGNQHHASKKEVNIKTFAEAEQSIWPECDECAERVVRAALSIQRARRRSTRA
jgi:hypothetical protein